MVDLISTHVEEIEVKLRGQLSPQAIEVIIRIHEESRMLQRAINDQQNIINLMKEALVQSTHLSKMLAGKIKQFERRYSDNMQDLINNEEVH